ncbi:HtaA domain-containing protein [Leucobacter soli]|uniref:Htaa domain-containing protein n=1 Tax=Leucobacter soli TaxID=2812850 RepID=A0A916K3N6_9MICO|nr:HtaA domain-containing protein [Leucobacter soli]CAG7620927.1 hypothetical protein LEUCIP111803_02399 [Leucobacter soli]
MTSRTFRRSAAALGGVALTGAALTSAVLAGSLLAAPAAALATPMGAAPAAAPIVAAEDTAGSCTITDGTLTWGVKESFRSYISGSIANGSWETSEGADYETPSFRWSDATGEIDPVTGTGRVSFTGSVHFTGHDGVLDLTLANPTIEFEGDGTAALMLDARSTDMEGEVTVDTEQEWVGDVTVADPVNPQGDALELNSMPTVLTNSGAKAFAGFYEAGESLDPLTLSLRFDGCESAAPVSEAPTTEDPDGSETDAPAEILPISAEASVPWLPIGIGAVALLVIGVTVGMLVGGRKRSAAGADGAEAGADADQAGSE